MFTIPGNRVGRRRAIDVVSTNVFTAAGTYVPRPNMLYCIIECVGGGGGGGGAQATTNYARGGGGGGGGYSRTLATASDIGTKKTVTIGAGGSGGASGANDGSAGGATSVGSLCVANGGSGGIGCTAAATNPSGGAGGAAGTGNIVAAPGNYGLFGVWASIGTVILPGGAGGNSVFGQGGQASIQNAAGVSGSGYGAGGSGGASWTDSTSKAGGNGLSGIVIITEFCY